MVRVAIDAMGGDFGSQPMVEGVLRALKHRDFEAILVGDKRKIEEHIPISLMDRVRIVEADDVIGMSESATNVIKRKNSSIYKTVDLVCNGEADALVSAGHSGATMSMATLKIKRLKNVSRPAIASLMPAVDGSKVILLDSGANVDCKSIHLCQFAIMGEVFSNNLFSKSSARVGLLSNGEEDSKGNDLSKETFEKLTKILPSFIGNVEGNDIFKGSVDVVVCDGFVGNIVLKTSEGVADAIMILLKKYVNSFLLAQFGAIFMKKVFKTLKKQLDYDEYGGAPLLGIKKCVIITHGKSSSKAIKNSIFQAIDYVDLDINSKIESKLDTLLGEGS